VSSKPPTGRPASWASPRTRAPGHRRASRNDAVDEYRAIQAASARPDKPLGWNTQITELLISPFTQQDYDQVRECVTAIAPIEARGMKVVTRVEFGGSVVGLGL
jgi:hypothetical protein